MVRADINSGSANALKLQFVLSTTWRKQSFGQKFGDFQYKYAFVFYKIKKKEWVLLEIEISIRKCFYPCSNFRSVFKTHLNIYDKTSWENGERLLVVNYFCKKLSRGCFARFLICLWTLSWLTVDQKEKFYHMPGLIRTFMRKLICYAYS